MMRIQKHQKIRKGLLFAFFSFFLAFSVFVPGKHNQAYALFGEEYALALIEAMESSTLQWSESFAETTGQVISELTIQKVFLVKLFWEDNLLPAMMMATNQLSAAALKQAQIVGAFIDAKNQMETQQVLQKIQARSHKDYHPSVGMCEFGTGVKSLALSERKSEYTSIVLNQRAQDRNLGAAYTVARLGELTDVRSRWDQYKKTYCDKTDNNNALSGICETTSKGSNRFNKDIDFTRTFDFPWTLNVDFTEDSLSPAEEDVFALATNLYGNVLASPAGNLASYDKNRVTALQQKYLDARSLVAKRSVAENSFNAIMGMKAQGSPGSREYVREILKRLGLDEEESARLVYGDDEWKQNKDEEYPGKLSPSYYAQMEILTKKMLQSPNFYTNLYDKPANVDRKGVALQAIGLMQKFDLFKSYLRQESLTSVLLEMAVMNEQEAIEGEIEGKASSSESSSKATGN